MGTRIATLAAVGLVLLVATRARADEGYVRIADPVDRMESVLHKQHDRAEFQRVLGGLGQAFAVVPLGLAGSIPYFGHDDYARAAGAAAMGVGGLYLVLGITRLALPGRAERRWDQWRALRARGPVSAAELARYEGELRQAADDEMHDLSAAAVFDIGLAVLVGGAAAVLAALDPPGSGFIVGEGASAAGMSLLFGVLNAVIVLAIGPPATHDLENYQRGSGPVATGPRVQLSPSGTSGTF